jgi:hypothetical protein
MSESDAGRPTYATPAIEVQEHRIKAIPTRGVVLTAQGDPVRFTIRAQQADRHDVAHFEVRGCEELHTVPASEEVTTEDLFPLRLRETAPGR